MGKITKEDIIRHFSMIPLDIEGGMWKAMFRSDERIPEEQLETGGREPYGFFP
jgi:hypothetical protein